MSKVAGKLKIGQWALVYWDDACCSTGDQAWIDPKSITEETHGVKHCVTAGRVVKLSKKQVILAQCAAADNEEDTEVGNIWAIPVNWVTKVEIWKDASNS